MKVFVLRSRLRFLQVYEARRLLKNINPDIAHGPRDYNEYVMPGPGDICPHDIAVLERPAPDGPFGGKGPGEMCANPVLPAVANAVYDAVGVRIDDLPITPEKVLRGIRANGGAKPRNKLAGGAR